MFFAARSTIQHRRDIGRNYETVDGTNKINVGADRFIDLTQINTNLESII